MAYISYWFYWYTFCRLFFALISVLTPEMEKRMEKTIGMRIKECRVKMGMTQDELAELMSIPKKTLSGYECDRTDIKGSVIADLARYLHTTPNYLLGFNEDSVTESIANMIRNISDEQVKKMLLVQIQALEKTYSLVK